MSRASLAGALRRPEVELPQVSTRDGDIRATGQVHGLVRLVGAAGRLGHRPDELLNHFRFALLELLLAPAEFLEFPLLLLDLILLPLQREERLLRLLHLGVEVLCR